MPTLIQSNKSSKKLAMLAAIASVIFLLFMDGCGGGGGGEPLPPDPPKPGTGSDSVVIKGVVYDGAQSLPIDSAVCVFVDTAGNTFSKTETTADKDGNFSLNLPPDTEGYIRCYPPDSPKLALLTFISTTGVKAGYEIDGADVTPATTIVANIIYEEDPADPQRRKEELLGDIDSDQDLKIVMVASTHLYSRMFQRHRNVIYGGFLNDDDQGGGEGGGGGGGGVGGAGGDGGDASPIVGARCEFIVGKDLASGHPLYSAALADFLDDGRVERSDLSLVAADIDSILQAYTPEEIRAAFRAFFPGGIGNPYDDITDQNGNYFIRTPPNVPGFVRCIPADRDELVLATYVPERQVSEILLGQDVNPATTLFSVEVAPKLSGDDVAAAKENFLKDIDGLNVYIRQKTVGGSDVMTFSLCEPLPGEVDPPETCTPNIDSNVGMMAFSATSVFNSFYKNDINGDFLTALSELSQNGMVPTAELEAAGVPTAQVTELSNDITIHAATVLKTRLDTAAQTARVKVTVTEVPGGTGIEGATVDTTSSYRCIDGCGGLTDASGLITLTFTGVPSDATDIEIVADGVPGYVEAKKIVTVSASSTVDLALAMDTSSPVVKILSPTTASTYTTLSKYLSISGTASDDTSVTQVTWANDKGGKGSCVGTTKWSTSDIVLVEGTNQIIITASDTAGNTGVATLTVAYRPLVLPIFPNPIPIVPILPVTPTVTITTPTSETFTTFSSKLKISGTATDNTGISSVAWVSENGGRIDRGTCLLSTKVGADATTVGWSASDVPLTSGTNMVTVTAVDKDKNTGSQTLTVLYKPLTILPIVPIVPNPLPIVNTNPVVTITSPTTEADYTTFVSTVTITGTAADDGGVTQVTWSSNNGSGGTCVGTDTWSTGDISLVLGVNEIAIMAYDGANNAATATLSVTYQLPTLIPIVPVIPIIKPIVPIVTR